jgi:alpha-1,3/alpha-1,6-mannosyltransferase
MSFADSIVVNSGFTKGVVGRVWPELVKSKDLEIVYPCVDVREKTFEEKEEAVAAWGDRGIILSINRFERKKDIGLAIKAYAGLGKQGREGTRLVLAGRVSHHGGTGRAHTGQVDMTIVCKKTYSAIRNL